MPSKYYVIQRMDENTFRTWNDWDWEWTPKMDKAEKFNSKSDAESHIDSLPFRIYQIIKIYIP